MARAPTEKIQELRAHLDRWAICNQAIATEMCHFGKLTDAHAGLITPIGSSPPPGAVQNAHRLLGLLGSHDGAPIEGRLGQAVLFILLLLVLRLEGGLSFPDAPPIPIWIGSDSAPNNAHPLILPIMYLTLSLTPSARYSRRP